MLAAAKSDRFRCAVEFAGGAMNWERTPRLRMIAAARKLVQPIFFIQAENDFSTRPAVELASALEGSGKIVEAKLFPAFGVTHWKGHLFERNGMLIWGPDARRFLARWL